MFFLSGTAETYCPPVAGYTVQNDTMVSGSDIGSYVASPASVCNNDTNCKGFEWVSSWVTNPSYYDKVGMGLPKSATSPTTSMQGLCTYTKLPSKRFRFLIACMQLAAQPLLADELCDRSVAHRVVFLSNAQPSLLPVTCMYS